MSFVFWMEIPGRSFIPFGSRMRILAGFFVSFGSWMGIPGRSFIPFGSWIRILGRFLILRGCPKSDPYKNGLIFYHGSAALHGFDHVVASRNGSSFLFFDERKEAKENQGNDRHLFLPCTCDPWAVFCTIGGGEGHLRRGAASLYFIYEEKVPLFFFDCGRCLFQKHVLTLGP